MSVLSKSLRDTALALSAAIQEQAGVAPEGTATDVLNSLTDALSAVTQGMVMVTHLDRDDQKDKALAALMPTSRAEALGPVDASEIIDEIIAASENKRKIN